MIIIRDVMDNISIDGTFYRLTEIEGAEYALPTTAPQWQYNSADGSYRTAQRDGTPTQHDFDSEIAATLATDKQSGDLDTAVKAWRETQIVDIGGA